MPVTVRGRTRTESFTLRLSCGGAAGLFVLLYLGVFGSALRAQTIRIKLLDGRSGRPMAGKCIDVWVGDRSAPTSRPSLETQTDKNGVAEVRLTGQRAEINNQSQRLACGLQGVIDPVVKYGDTITIGSDYVLCQARLPDGSWQALEGFPTKDALQSGVATANTCGEASASPRPGWIIIFVRPRHWWEKLKE